MTQSGPHFARRFLDGVELFNAEHFWHAHEAWEELWLGGSEDFRPFLQGLIQLAAAYHHVQRGTLSGGVRLFAAALEKLEPYPERFFGVERDGLVTAAKEHQQWTSRNLERGDVSSLSEVRYPRIRLSADWQSRLPSA